MTGVTLVFRHVLSLLLSFCVSPVLHAIGPRKDTAGYMLSDVWRDVRTKYPDAVLLSIGGRTGADGVVVCDTHYPMAEGWRYHFYSAAGDAYLLMGRCENFIMGPLREYRSIDKSKGAPIDGRFVDADRALEILSQNKISLDPEDHQGGGKRPFTLTLFRTRDPRLAGHPVLWRIDVGKSVYMVNAETQKLLRDAPDESLAAKPSEHTASSSGSGTAPAGGTSGPMSTGGAGSTTPPVGRPKRPRNGTAKTDLERVKRFVKLQFPGSLLMSIEGIADAWGGTACAGAGDGWAYYYYLPQARSIEVVSSCNGQVGLGRATYVPVDLNMHRDVTTDFIDSDKAIDSLLDGAPAAMNEGLGRNYTRKVTMRLLNYQSPPFHRQQDPRGVTLLWELEFGSSVHYVDARKGIYIGAKEKY